MFNPNNINDFMSNAVVFDQVLNTEEGYVKFLALKHWKVCSSNHDTLFKIGDRNPLLQKRNRIIFDTFLLTGYILNEVLIVDN